VKIRNKSEAKKLLHREQKKNLETITNPHSQTETEKEN
jgi:hypothetical protein